MMNATQSIDLVKYPIRHLDSEEGFELAGRCCSELTASGILILPGFLRSSAVERCVEQLAPVIERSSFVHNREHNIYFDDSFDGVSSDHPALARMHTTSQTVCGDQIESSILSRIYHWQPMIDFLAAVVGKSRLYPMDDPLAGLNVKSFRDGDITNWHFDRAEFTITMLLQKPEAGGVFQIRRNLRSDGNPNYEGVANLLNGNDAAVRSYHIDPGTLTVFRGKHSAHRVSTVVGNRLRIVAVLSYFDSPGVRFSDPDRIQFYGRREPIAHTAAGY